MLIIAVVRKSANVSLWFCLCGGVCLFTKIIRHSAQQRHLFLIIIIWLFVFSSFGISIFFIYFLVNIGLFVLPNAFAVRSVQGNFLPETGTHGTSYHLPAINNNNNATSIAIIWHSCQMKSFLIAVGIHYWPINKFTLQWAYSIQYMELNSTQSVHFDMQINFIAGKWKQTTYPFEWKWYKYIFEILL